MTQTKFTPAPWWVRKREQNGKIVDCFVAANSFQGNAYDSEILGDDEYQGEIVRRLADCNLIASAPEMYKDLEDLVNVIEEHNLALRYGFGDRIIWAIENAKKTLVKARGE